MKFYIKGTFLYTVLHTNCFSSHETFHTWSASFTRIILFCLRRRWNTICPEVEKYISKKLWKKKKKKLVTVGNLDIRRGSHFRLAVWYDVYTSTGYVCSSVGAAALTFFSPRKLVGSDGDGRMNGTHHTHSRSRRRRLIARRKTIRRSRCRGERSVSIRKGKETIERGTGDIISACTAYVVGSNNKSKCVYLAYEPRDVVHYQGLCKIVRSNFDENRLDLRGWR